MLDSPHSSSLGNPLQATRPVRRAAHEWAPSLWPDRVYRRQDLRSRAAAYYAHLQALPRRVRRALQRRWGVSLATLALWLALGALPALAATIPVGGGCTLVDAITAANTDTATGGCPAGSGADTILLPPGSTQTLTEVNNDTFGPTGLPVVESVITLAGQGSTILRAEGAPEFRLLAVRSTGDLMLQDTTVRGGAPSGYYRGGGVANFGTLTVTNSTITSNTGFEGGGVWNYFGNVTVLNSTITGNSAGVGGGVWNSGTLTVTNSTITGNTASNYSGVANFGTLTVAHSTISGNTAHYGRGGGMTNFGGTLTMTHSTISGNTAPEGGAWRTSSAARSPSPTALLPAIPPLATPAGAVW